MSFLSSCSTSQFITPYRPRKYLANCTGFKEAREMEVPILAAVVSSTLPRLYSVIDSVIEDRSNRGARLERDVDSIKMELRYVVAVIRNYPQKNRSKMSDDLRRATIEDLRHLAYDMEDCVDSFFAGTLKSQQLPAKISELKKTLEDTHKRLERYIPDELWKQEQHQDLCLQGPDIAVDQDDHMIVGVEKISDEIKALLRESQIPSERKLRAIFIVGFGGTGKTLLADLVYKEQCHQFPRHASVRAAGKNKTELLKDILKQLQQQDVQQDDGVHGANVHMDITEEVGSGVHGGGSASNNAILQGTDEVITLLRSSLGTNRYLILIDGIEAEEFGSYVLSAFPRVNEVDSRIMVTTTVQSVAKSIHASRCHVYKMRPLDEENSKKLFLRVACEVEEEELSIAEMDQSSVSRKKCDGVPLALVSMARFCNGHLSRWEDAWNNLCTYTPEPKKDYRLARMQRVLDHSYDTLCSPDLRACLLYFSMFPSDHHVRRGSLLRQWVAEGPEVGCSTSDDAVKNFNALIDRSILWPIHVGNNERVKTCRPPGMLHEYIARISEDEKFITRSSSRNRSDAECVRRLSVHNNTDTGAGAGVDSGLHNLRRLRTLVVFNEGDEGDQLSFDQYELLRVLHLEARNGFDNKQLKQICGLLKLLKYLSLRANITEVPRRITKLKWLETLDLGKEMVISVPAELLKLPNLKHLLGKLTLYEKDGEDQDLKRFLSRKSALETLSGFVTGKSRGFPQLMRSMRRLRKVKIWCNSDASRTNTEDLSRSIKKFLREADCTPRIHRFLAVDFNDCTKRFLDGVLASREEHPGSLFSLKLRGVLSPVPAFVTKLSGIKELCLSSTTLSWDAVVRGVGNLTVLEYLKLVSETNIEVEGDIVIKCGQFTGLKRMCLVAEQSVPQITIQAGALKHLVSLHLLCPGLEGHSADQIRHIRSLEEVALHSGVAQGTWKEAARDHPNRPNVVFIDRPRTHSPTQRGILSLEAAS